MANVLVAMSGGVDSSVAAWLLQQQGYECSGAMLKLFSSSSTKGFSEALSSDDAALVSQTLGMPFFVLDEQETFSRCVMDHFVSEYLNGRTPNPCIDCNRALKFGAFLDRALERGFDYIATGHYARVSFDEASGRYLLLRGKDAGKDQSYMLYQLTQHQLRHLLLPVGEYAKAEIRSLAENAHLENAHKSDSQDICFVPDGDYASFLKQYGNATLTPGDFVDAAGKVLGRHNGLPCYTLGQRKGLGVSAGSPVYVLEKNAEKQTILLGDESALFSKTVWGSRVNYIPFDTLTEPMNVTAKTRYTQHEAEAVLYPDADGVRVEFREPQRAVTPGQAMVFYSGEQVIGGATIEKAV